MGRRAQKPELEFGSDSFLDVVCNIVGILIILIVVVAVKVERQPKGGRGADVTAADPVTRPTEADEDAQIAKQMQALEVVRAADQSATEILKELQSERVASEDSVQQLMEQQELIHQQMETRQALASELKQQEQDAESDQQLISSRITALEKTVAARNQNVLKLGEALATATITERELDEQLEVTVVETQRLQEVLEEAQKEAVPRDRLQHRLSPVTKTVEKDELHFRVENGRVSQIPIEELLERLKAQVTARRSTVIRFNQFEGTVGPVQGYNMTYVVEKEGPSTLEALQSGDGRMRINVSRWTITPDETLTDESIEDAIRPGSRYRQIVETASPDTVVTMWIYPDSFTAFAPLREVAHALQLRVAARPLPAGTPIVGSPNGSRSTAQ